MSVLELTQPVSMIRWPSIELFHNLRRSLAAVEQSLMLTYRAKVKLDGTNAAVQVFPDGRVIAQSRSQLITPEKDNMGFAQWLAQGKEALRRRFANDSSTFLHHHQRPKSEALRR